MNDLGRETRALRTTCENAQTEPPRAIILDIAEVQRPRVAQLLDRFAVSFISMPPHSLASDSVSDHMPVIKPDSIRLMHL